MFATITAKRLHYENESPACLATKKSQRGEKEEGGGCVTHSLTLMERAERAGEEGEKKIGAGRAQLRRQKRRRNTRGEPVSPSPRLIYLNLRNSVSCVGVCISVRHRSPVPKVSGEGRETHRTRCETWHSAVVTPQSPDSKSNS